jgi:MFS family permease
VTDRFSAFRHSAYSRYFFSRFCTSLGVQIVSVSVGWQIYDQTQNAALLGWIGLVQFLPALVLVVVTGVTADRFGRRNVMGLAVFVEMACALAILALALSGHFDPVLVLGTLTVFGIARAFYSPASSSLAVNLVPKEDFANAVGWITASWQLASILGPVLGGLIYGIGAPSRLRDGGVPVPVLRVRSFSPSRSLPQKSSKEPTTLKTLLGGFSYVWKEKVVLGAISLDLFAVSSGRGGGAFLPIYARDILELGPSGLGLLRAAPGVGAVDHDRDHHGIPDSEIMPESSCSSAWRCSALRPSSSGRRRWPGCRFWPWRWSGHSTWCRSTSARSYCSSGHPTMCAGG